MKEADWFGVIFQLALFGSIIALTVQVGLVRREKKRQEESVRLRGVEVEAEIVARYEAGALAGSEQAKARATLATTWDEYELELRYSFDGKEIVSRGHVSIEGFFRTRGMQRIRIRVAPEQPEQWAAV